MMSPTSLESCEAFSKSAEIYDLIHSGKDYDGEAARVLELLGPVPVKPNDWLADWGCGTGEFSLRFEDAGWAVVGYDNCSDMLHFAARKGVNIQQDDMRFPRCQLRWNSQTCLFAAFSYASAGHPPLLILENFRKAAAPGGKLVFDFVNADAELRRHQSRNVAGIEVEQVKRLVDMRLIENLVGYRTSKDYWHELHYLRTFTRREMAELIARAGWNLGKFTNIEDSHREFNGGPEPYYLTAVCTAPSHYPATPQAAA